MLRLAPPLSPYQHGAGTYIGGLQIEADDTSLGHLFARESNPFTTDAAQFRAAKWHDVEPIVGRIVHDDGTDHETPHGSEGVAQALGEYRRVQPVVDSVRLLDRVIER